MAPKQAIKRTTAAAAFTSRKTIDLPVPGPDGSALAAVVQAITWEDMVEQTKRLPGGLPGALMDRVRAEKQRTEDELPRDFGALMEAFENAKHDYALLLPTVKGIVNLGAVEPRFQFPDEPPAPDLVPWKSVHPANQSEIFLGILRVSGYAGGAAERVESFCDGGREGGVGRVGSVRSRKTVGPQAVRGVPVPADRRGRRKAG